MTKHGAGSAPPRIPGLGPDPAWSVRLQDHIASRTPGRIRDLEVTCTDGAVTLRGWSRTQYAKQLAQEAALEWIALAGGSRFLNEIVVT